MRLPLDMNTYRGLYIAPSKASNFRIGTVSERSRIISFVISFTLNYEFLLSSNLSSERFSSCFASSAKRDVKLVISFIGKS